MRTKVTVSEIEREGSVHVGSLVSGDWFRTGGSYLYVMLREKAEDDTKVFPERRYECLNAQNGKVVVFSHTDYAHPVDIDIRATQQVLGVKQ